MVIQEALKQGADYLELDLVATKDSKLVLRSGQLPLAENWLSLS